jgi:meiosis induction protein kinase IME2/SME1
MTVSHEFLLRGSTQNSVVALEDRFEVLKEIGDGSFGSVVLARTRTAGSNVARRGTMVCFRALLLETRKLIRSSRSPSRQ